MARGKPSYTGRRNRFKEDLTKRLIKLNVKMQVHQPIFSNHANRRTILKESLYWVGYSHTVICPSKGIANAKSKTFY